MSRMIKCGSLAEFLKKKPLINKINNTIKDYGFLIDGHFLSRSDTLNVRNRAIVPINDTQSNRTIESLFDTQINHTIASIKDSQNNRRIAPKKDTQNNGTIVPISNFICWPSREFEVQESHQITFEYEVEGILLDSYRSLPPVRLTAKQLNTADWVQQYWGLDPRVQPKMYKHLYEVFHLLRESRKHARIISETGWHKFNNAWYYLHSGGAIGEEPPEEEIHCNLDDPKLAGYILPDNCPDIQKAAKAMFDVLKIGKPNIAYPLATMIWIPPLAEIFRQNGAQLDFVPFLKGPTGCGKSLSAGLALSAYGNMDKFSFPASFRDTIASTESTFAKLKDSLCVIDDYHPRSQSEQRAMDTLADSIGRMIADGNVRNRSKQFSPKPKTFVVATGEIIPSIAESGLSRYLFIECTAENLYYAGKFSEVSSHAPLLREFMYAYISWIASNWDKVSSILATAFKTHLTHYSAIGGGHTVNPVAKMESALEIGLTFFRELGLLDEQGLSDHLDMYRTVLEAILCANIDIQIAASPVDLFLSGLQHAVNCGEAVLVPSKSTKLPARGIGCFDKTNIYLLPEKAYDRVSRFLLSRNQKGLLAEKDVWKNLENKNILTWDSTRKRHTKQKRLRFMGGKNIEVLVIDRKHVPELSL